MPRAEVLQRQGARRVDVGPVAGFELKKVGPKAEVVKGQGAKAKEAAPQKPGAEPVVLASFAPRVEVMRPTDTALNPAEVSSLKTALTGEQKTASRTVTDYCYSKTPIC